MTNDETQPKKNPTYESPTSEFTPTGQMRESNRNVKKDLIR